MKKFCLLALLSLSVALNVNAKATKTLGTDVDAAVAAVSTDVAEVQAALFNLSGQQGAQYRAAELTFSALGLAGGAFLGHKLTLETIKSLGKTDKELTDYAKLGLAGLVSAAYARQDLYAAQVDQYLGNEFTNNTGNAALVGALLTVATRLLKKATCGSAAYEISAPAAAASGAAAASSSSSSSR